MANAPMVLRKMREQYKATGKAVTFNRTRATLRSYISDTIGQFTELYAAVSNVKPLRVEPKRKGRHLSVAEVRELMNKLEPVYRGMVWTCCLTGMRVLSEFIADVWTIDRKRHAIHVRGTKTVRSDRLVPLVEVGLPLIHAMAEYKAFRVSVRKASKRKITLGDFRKTYVHWLELAGVPRSNRKAYMSHGRMDTTDIYELHEVEAFLKEDGEKVAEVRGKRTEEATESQGATFLPSRLMAASGCWWSLPAQVGERLLRVASLPAQPPNRQPHLRTEPRLVLEPKRIVALPQQVAGLTRD
jgi:integrase